MVFIISPYCKVDKSVTPHRVTTEIDYLLKSGRGRLAQYQANEDGAFANDLVMARFRSQNIEVNATATTGRIAKQVVCRDCYHSVLENDDSNRALDGC